jgi:hypothetical protein
MGVLLDEDVLMLQLGNGEVRPLFPDGSLGAPTMTTTGQSVSGLVAAAAYGSFFVTTSNELICYRSSARTPPPVVVPRPIPPSPRPGSVRP